MKFVCLSVNPWSIIMFSVLVQLMACLVTLFCAAAGHGSYIPAMLLFPITMISTYPYGSILKPFIVLAMIQFPVYGIILAFAYYKKRLQIIGTYLLIFHALAIMVAMLFTNDSFR